MIVNLGRRLVDVRFFHGHVDSAIDLAEDILYNLRQVYGPSHHSAVEMMNLLSSIYMSKGDRAAALAVHEAVDSGPQRPSIDGNTVSEHPAQAEKAVRSKIESLLHEYHSSGGAGRSVGQSSSLIDELTKKINTPASSGSKKRPFKGHQPPENWSFAESGEEERIVR